MAVTRSPSYPNISLSDAIGKARQIYQKEHMSMMTPTVVAEAMGYNGINGASLKTIASLKKYGLLEGRGEGLRLTKDAQTLAIDDPNSQDYRAALARAAATPDIFGELSKQFPGPASERNIAVYLEKQGFIPEAALTVARHYKESLTLVSGNPVGYAGREDDAPEAPVSQPQAQPAPGESRMAPFTMAAQGSQTPAPTPGLPRVVQDGKQLTIQAVVDLKGLRKLKQMLNNYEKLLEMMEDDDEDLVGNLDIKPELQQ